MLFFVALQITALILMVVPLTISIVNTKRNKPLAVLENTTREAIRKQYPDCFAYQAINGKWYVWNSGDHAMDYFNTTSIK